jgi:hypothetical protein
MSTVTNPVLAHVSEQDLIARLVELTEQVSVRDIEALTRILAAQGGSLDLSFDGVTYIARLPGLTVGIDPAGDPLTVFISVCMALFGWQWPQLACARAAMREIKKRWKTDVKAGRNSA